ncbi:DegT/DnrJ/EryC1/StrS family aminotransferase [Tateyamaria sp. ANG-S1]|uniref:DegT/DnrJ/EryC1/StrS family aminotransferase n=1 Tax=Tateyamaria sp. ANG-S1 TaxID=1577905 RepID=UPI00057E68D0|nr:DegT/DnrJ/EryC1/StrS family aminotransferase [Tateyamaria sp. ANG-S1]KIC50421.1 erythromycin biosynthesis sensory transduction protein eryC1 [Tateyamaria sp. ANG-S1]
MKVPFVDLGRAYDGVSTQAAAAFTDIARSGQYILGENVRALEAAVADYLGVQHTVAVGSGTDALHLALLAMGISPGDEVITTPFTFAATVEAIEYVGATAVLIDIDQETYNMDPAHLEAAITERTRAIIAVHLFGRPADMSSLLEIARRHNLVVIEDCAQAFGATVKDQRVGSIGHAGAFSFYPTKTLGGLGDGGMIATNDPAAAGRIRELRNHGASADGEHRVLGFNSRLDEVQAAVIHMKLGHIDKMNTRRREIAARYSAVLAGSSATVPAEDLGAARSVFGYYTILVDDRDRFRVEMADRGIATAIYYPKPLHRHAHFAQSCRAGSLPVAERIAARCVSLPIFPEMTEAEVDYVAATSVACLA